MYTAQKWKGTPKQHNVTQVNHTSAWLALARQYQDWQICHWRLALFQWRICQSWCCLARLEVTLWCFGVHFIFLSSIFQGNILTLKLFDWLGRRERAMTQNKLRLVLTASAHETKSRLVFEVCALFNVVTVDWLLFYQSTVELSSTAALLLATVWPFMVDSHSNSSQTYSWQQQMYWLRLMDPGQSAVDSKLLCVLGTGWKAPNTLPGPVISLPDIGVETLCVDSQGLERLCWLMGVRWGLEVETIQKSCNMFCYCEIYSRVLHLTVILWQIGWRWDDWRLASAKKCCHLVAGKI